MKSNLDDCGHFPVLNTSRYGCNFRHEASKKILTFTKRSKKIEPTEGGVVGGSGTPSLGEEGGGLGHPNPTYPSQTALPRGPWAPRSEEDSVIRPQGGVV